MKTLITVLMLVCLLNAQEKAKKLTIIEKDDKLYYVDFKNVKKYKLTKIAYPYIIRIGHSYDHKNNCFSNFNGTETMPFLSCRDGYYIKEKNIFMDRNYIKINRQNFYFILDKDGKVIKTVIKASKEEDKK